jgi:hypothetical protein
VTGIAAAVLTAAGSVFMAVPHAFAATTTLYASPSGTGTSCSDAQPCSLSAAQAAVRSRVGGMSGDIVVQLAGGTYRLTAPLAFTAADSGTGGHTVGWQAAPQAHPVVSGAKAVTGWTLADAGKNIWQASVGAGVDARQLYVNGAIATRARTTVNRSDFTASNTGLRFTNTALTYLNNLANQNRVELESVGSFTDRYVPVQSISGNFITMQQPAWNNNTFGYDTFTSPHRAGPLYLENAYEFLDSAGEWYLNPSTGVLSYLPSSGQNMSNLSVELPTLQSLVGVGGTYDAPAHNISFSGITFSGTSWLGPSSNQGYADQQTGSYIAGNWSWPALSACQEGCSQFEAARPNWFQMPAAVQVSAANTITFSDSQFVNLGQTAIGIGNDANAHASGVGLGASNITVTRSEIARDAAGGIVVGGVRADAHHPSDQRMVNRNITVSNNRIHDLGVDYRGIVSVLTTYVSTATVSHNEVYNLPYTGMSIGYGWGANEPGGSTSYANRGLYNYQPRYTTATTASNNRLTNNYVHDVMQQMTDGGCIYTLSWNPSAVISGNYCLRTNGWFGLYFDEGSKYYTASNNVFSSIGTWATANYWGGENMVNFTVTNNWTSNSSTNVTNGDRGNVVSGNVTVTNGAWPSGAQAVMASAGVEPPASSPPPSASSSAPSPSTSSPSRPPSSPSSSGSSAQGTGCGATYQITNSWAGGFQGGVTVTNTGTTSLAGWTVAWTFPNGQAITQVWNGVYTQAGSNVTVTNVSWNGALAPGQAATFGLLADWNTTNDPPPTLSCR